MLYSEYENQVQNQGLVFYFNVDQFSSLCIYMHMHIVNTYILTCYHAP
jgi:hypothetical protein